MIVMHVHFRYSSLALHTAHCTVESSWGPLLVIRRQEAYLYQQRKLPRIPAWRRQVHAQQGQKLLRRRIVAKQLFTRVAIELSELRGCCSNCHWKGIPCYNITAKQGQEVSTQRLLLARRRSTRNGNSTIFHNAVELSAVRPWQCKRIGDHNTSAQDGKYSPQIVR